MTTPPAPCHATHKDEPNGAPYFVEDFLYGHVIRTPNGGTVTERRLRPLVNANSWIRAICEAPGSPYVAVPKEQHEATVRRMEEMRQEIEALQEANDNLNAILDETPPQIDLSQFVEQLDDRYARKSGRKPKAPA